MPSTSRRRILEAGAAFAGLAGLGAPAIADSAPVRIGAVLELSGGLELFGNQAKLGIDLAAAEINASGGLLGRPVEILYEDNRTDPKTAVERATKLIQRDQVLAILGPITSNARDAMMPTMSRRRTPLLYATNYEGGACGKEIFCFNTVPNQELANLVPFLAGTEGRRFHLFGADYVWPQKMFDTAQGLIAAAGGKVVGRDLTPFGVKEFTPVIRRIEESGAEVLLFALPGADGITFIRQAGEQGLLQRLKVGFLGFTEAYLGAFGPEGADDMWVAVPFVASSDEPGVQDFVQRVRRIAAADTPISHYVMTHYNALKAVQAAVEQTDNPTSEALIGGLEGLEIEGPTGPLTIDAESHHVTLAMYLARTRGNSLETFEALGRIAPVAGCS